MFLNANSDLRAIFESVSGTLREAKLPFPETAGAIVSDGGRTVVGSFLAIQMEPAGDIRTAARRKQIDFNHEAFDDLKSFLLKLFESIDSTVDSS